MISETLPKELVVLEKIHCPAKYLCPRPFGSDFCLEVNSDYRGCLEFVERGKMYQVEVPPDKVMCEDACRCKYATKRPDCALPAGHELCGIVVNASIPEGEIPDSILTRIRAVLPLCRLPA